MNTIEKDKPDKPDYRDDFTRRMQEDGEYNTLRRQECLAKCEAKYRRQDHRDESGETARMR
jgi:hypothetical protein